MLVVIEFDEEPPVLEFERYLKTGSGCESAFARTAAFAVTAAVCLSRTRFAITAINAAEMSSPFPGASSIAKESAANPPRSAHTPDRPPPIHRS